MAKSANQKLKLLFLAKIFQEKTDDEHYLTMPQIIAELGRYGIEANRKSIYTDLDALELYGMDIVKTRVAQLSKDMELNSAMPADSDFVKIVTVFRELREGKTLDGQLKIKPTSGVLSSAEAISLMVNSMALAGSFGNGKVTDSELAAALQGAVVKDDDKDKAAWEEYLENIMRKKGSDYASLYAECRERNA